MGEARRRRPSAEKTGAKLARHTTPRRSAAHTTRGTPTRQRRSGEQDRKTGRKAGRPEGRGPYFVSLCGVYLRS